MTDAATIAKGLTKARKTALWNLGTQPGRDGWQPAPRDGWRRSGQACSQLVKIDLAERQMNGRIMPPQPEYRLTPLGLAVRAHLQEQAR